MDVEPFGNGLRISFSNDAGPLGSARCLHSGLAIQSLHPISLELVIYMFIARSCARSFLALFAVSFASACAGLASPDDFSDVPVATESALPLRGLSGTYVSRAVNLADDDIALLTLTMNSATSGSFRMVSAAIGGDGPESVPRVNVVTSTGNVLASGTASSGYFSLAGGVLVLGRDTAARTFRFSRNDRSMKLVGLGSDAGATFVLTTQP
jgi:hypothetical protein